MSVNPPTKAPETSNTPVSPPADCLVVFIEPKGTQRPVSVLRGQNLMDAALAAGVAGITGQCGGAINCATCLCDFDDSQLLLLPPQHPDEAELLSYVDEASTNSRLACQLIGSADLSGLVAQVVVSITSPDD